MPEPGEQPRQEPQPQQREFAFTRLPNGELIGIFEMMDRELLRGEVQMNTALLKPDDLIAIQYPKEDQTNGGFMFKVAKAEWGDLGMGGGHSPKPTLVGRLQGADLPEEVNGKEATFSGSGFGGPMRQPGVLVTGRSPYFSLDEGQFRAPNITNFKIFRKDENNELRVIDQDQLDAEVRKESEKHRQRLAQVEELMELFGFRGYDCKNSQIASHDYRQVPMGEELEPQIPTDRVPEWQLVYEDDRYISQYKAEMAMDNQLAVFDKTTGKWMGFKYYNYNDEEMLQIAVVDLSGHEDLSKVYDSTRLIEDRMPYESQIHATGRAITTFTSSGRYGIDAINYMPGDTEVDDILKQLNVNKLQIPRPNIQILPGNEIRVATYARSDWMEQNHPGLLERIKNGVTVDSSPEGTITLGLNGNTIKLDNPDGELATIAQYMRQAKTSQAGIDQPEDTSLTGRLGQAVGRFIRRGK